MVKKNLTTEALQNLYLQRKDEEILVELFGDDRRYFDFEEYKSVSGWDNKNFNPLHELIGQAEFLVAQTEGHSEEEKEKIYKEVLKSLSV